MRYLIFTFLFAFLFGSFCFGLISKSTPVIVAAVAEMSYEADPVKETLTVRGEADEIINLQKKNEVDTEPVAGPINPQEFVDFAKTFIGIPYVYGSTDPKTGFDCSGFINHVSKHFGLEVPRSSVEFTDIGAAVSKYDAIPGDFILFTGTDPNHRVVGHMGIVIHNQDGQLEFIHSSSGKSKGVVTSALEGYYETRFVKVIRLLPQA